MRGSRAKSLRTADRPNPGRKHGGENKDLVVGAAWRPRKHERMARSPWYQNILRKGRKNGRT
jgi:hypothetical protein